MENENAFKHKINEVVVEKMAMAIKRQYPAFKVDQFENLSEDLKSLELKDRVLLITRHLKLLLPEPYPEALQILVNTMEDSDLSGFELWPFSEYISQFGLEHFDQSMKAMYVLTQRFTAEFAVRPFLLKNHTRVLKYFSKWIKDRNVHIRRWISEGSRPLLPWGQKIPLFVLDPTHTLILLDQLRFDEELYVRKSVANHLNDISKNHPQVVIDVLKLWGEEVPREHQEKYLWIKRHALRTLIKKGHSGALKLMGVKGKAAVKVTGLRLNQKTFKLHDVLVFSFSITSTSSKSQRLIIDYSIDFMKANGKKGKKVFKLKTVDLGPKERIEICKKHSLKPITTMKYYPGIHHLSIHINGSIGGELKFSFT